MRNIAIIPARGGSKRIPRKNIKPFMGKPIMAYSIEAALKSNLFDVVMVSTDDAEIADIARQYGAEVPFMRSERTSNDYAGIAEVIEEVLTNYYKKGVRFENFCCILSTAPFVTETILQDSFNVFRIGRFDTLRPVVRFTYPIQRAYKMLPDNGVHFINPEYLNVRSQDLDPAYHDAGMFYWGTVESGFRGDRWGGFEVDEKYCQDIDTEDDWILAEMKYTLQRKRK